MEERDGVALGHEGENGYVRLVSRGRRCSHFCLLTSSVSWLIYKLRIH